MLNLLNCLGTGRFHFNFDLVPAMRQDAFWIATTLALSALVVIGYCVIAINWYFQSKLARHADSRATLKRLRTICLCTAICGTTFYLTDMPWIVWRFYDLCLVVFAWSCWSFIWRMRGLSLVDERLAQVDELARAAIHYREIAELLPHMVWTADASGNVDFVNQRWRDHAGGDISWLEAVHPEDRFRVLTAWNAAVAARLSVSFEARLNGRDGYRAFVVRATPIMQGDTIKWLGACADIEDQKLLAAEKEQQARQKSFFLNALSHDLRAPLHNVLLNAQLLKISSEAGEPVDAEALAMIVENSVAAGDLVARLLDFARVDAGDQNVIESISLPALLNQVARRYQPLAEQKGLDVRRSDVADADGLEGCHIDTDRQKLERIIGNLIENAIKYTARGGVTLELAIDDQSDRFAIRVRDSGIGIPQDKVDYLFNEFYQVNNYERDRSKGFGMGLAICRSLARHIGADVRLASSGADGSCFEILLDRAGGACISTDPALVAEVIGDRAADSGADRAADSGGDGGGASAIVADSGGGGGKGRAGHDATHADLEQPLGPDRRGRPLGAAGDCDDPEAAGLCRF
jgi:signal transduction histidine kinase